MTIKKLHIPPASTMRKQPTVTDKHLRVEAATLFATDAERQEFIKGYKALLRGDAYLGVSMIKTMMLTAALTLPLAANAQQPLTLSCSGRWHIAGGSKDEAGPIDNLGVIVGAGSISFSGLSVPVIDTTATQITFQGWVTSGKVITETDYFSGTIDRVTGEMEESIVYNDRTKEMELHCTPAKPLF